MTTARAESSLRSKLKAIPGARSSVYLSIALGQLIADEWKKPSSFDRVFSDASDPWNSTSATERNRFAVTMDTLNASGVSVFDSAIEIGCAEGIFTEHVAPRCRRLLALDFSMVALERARERLIQYPQVTVKQWDMRREHIPGQYQLVIAMGVITSLYRPRDVRRICREIVDATSPGGFILFSDVRQSRVFETAWWGRYLLRGGEQIRRLLTRQSELELVKSADTDSHVFALYKRRG